MTETFARSRLARLDARLHRRRQPDGAIHVVNRRQPPGVDRCSRARLHRPGVARDALLADGRRARVGSAPQGQRSRRLPRLLDLARQGRRQAGVGRAARVPRAQHGGAAAKQDASLPDPVLSIGADAIRLEVLSRDESTYAQLVLRAHAFGGTPAPGTTFVAFDADAVAAIGRVRSYRATTLELAPGEAEARQRAVPTRWLRAFGQMQAASLLAADRFELSPVDLYNVLLQLRLKKARTAPRGLRYELVPGERPRLVLELRGTSSSTARAVRAVQGHRAAASCARGAATASTCFAARVAAREEGRGRRRRPGPARDLLGRPRRRHALARAVGLDRRGLGGRRDVRPARRRRRREEHRRRRLRRSPRRRRPTPSTSPPR